MKIVIGKFLQNDTVEQIAVKLKRRPADYILYKTPVNFAGGYEGCRGKKAFDHRQSLGAVTISILQ